MIINSLCQYYERLLEDETSGVSRPGYSKAKVSYALVLSHDGELINILDLRVEKGTKLVSRELNVPEQLKRTSGVSPNFMCDNCTYVFGLRQKDKGDKKARNKEAFEAFLKFHTAILGDLKDEGAIALVKFLNTWDTATAETHPRIASVLEGLVEGGNLVFRLEGADNYLHERPEIMCAWDKHRSGQNSQVTGQCLVTGKETAIARLHPNIKGVVGAQSSGASLVSFNLDAFTSYGKTQSYNAPVSEGAAFAYTTALNYLLSSEKHRMRVGDTTTVFWAERSSTGLEEDLLGALFFPVNENNQKSGGDLPVVTRDPQTVQLVHDIFVRIREGKPVNEGLLGVDLQVRFNILGLAPNASRLAIRFWHVDKFGMFVDRISQHYRDMAIVKSFDNEPEVIPIPMILKETAPLGDSKRISPLLGGVFMRAILTGMPYPQVLYNAIISRIRADQEVNYVRAAIVKAYLTRNARYYKKGNEVNITMALNEQNEYIGYRLGRLFALLEKAQENANPGLNATIKDRYFGAASATPGSVFPILLRLAQHHIAKAEYGLSIDKRIEEVMNVIDNFPAHLNLEEQGMFVLGYYHQRQALYKKTEKKEGVK